MESNKDQELIIVNAISQMVIPNDVFENSEFKEIIVNFKGAQDGVTSSLGAVESASQDVKNGNFLGNWFHNRKDKLQDAQLNLNKSVGELTKQSSDLILFNTAISKVLVSQQKVLHEQQELLKEQATELASQNKNIKNHQIKLSEQQEEIVKANQGLLEAKGLTREQAERLVGCVKRVEMAEQKMEYSNQELERSVINRIVEAESHILAVKNEFERVLASDQQKTASAINSLSESTNSRVAGLSEQISIAAEKANRDAALNASELASIKNCFSARLDDFQSALKTHEVKFATDLESIMENVTSKVDGVEEKLKEVDGATTEKHRKLFLVSASTLFFSALAIGISVYSLVVLK